MDKKNITYELRLVGRGVYD